MYHERLTASPSRGWRRTPYSGPRSDSRWPRRSRRTSCGPVGRQGQRCLVERRWKDLDALRIPAGRRQDAPGPIVTNADGSVLLWSFGTGSSTRAPFGGQRRHLVRDRLLPQGRHPGRGPRGPHPLLRLRHTTGTLYASTDSGKTFTARATGLNSGDRVPAGRGPGTLRRPVAEPKGNGLYRSTDGGATFTRWAVAGPRTPSASARPPRAPRTRGSTWSAGSRHHRRVPFRRRGQDLDTDQRRPAPVGLDRSGHAGDPRIHGRVYIATNGRGVQYGEPA